MGKDTLWFRHDYDASDDDKTMVLIEQLGLEGYGIYWVLIEKLRGRKDYKMPFSIIPSLARRYMTTPEKMKTVIMQYGLFQYDDEGFFYSESLISRMVALDELKQRRANAGKKAIEARWSREKDTKCIANEYESYSKRIPNEQQANTNAIRLDTDKSRVDKSRIENKEKEDNKLSSKKKFNFKQALLDLGVCENVVKDFMLVRKNKHATDSETAFKRLQTEIIKSGLSANDCITIAVENDWKGFRVEWIQKQNRKYSIEGFSSYSPKNVTGRACVYMNTLTVPVQIEKNGIKYLSDGTYVENGKRYYTHRIRGKVEVSMGAVARPNEDWEWNSSTLTWEQDERTITISDMLF